MKRLVREFHVVVVQLGQRNAQISVIREQRCCFAYSTSYFLTSLLLLRPSLLKLPNSESSPELHHLPIDHVKDHFRGIPQIQIDNFPNYEK